MGICKILSTFACNPDRQAVRALQSQPEGAPVRDSCSKANVDPTVGNGLLTPQRVGEGARLEFPLSVSTLEGAGVVSCAKNKLSFSSHVERKVVAGVFQVSKSLALLALLGFVLALIQAANQRSLQLSWQITGDPELSLQGVILIIKNNNNEK
ncbi:hypothetical protein C0Q70_09538 [Pomacea canaliculata]|uniref:Uncharacterized protein n=1 Tax=Pomacea canaliculata TaxID=400727 RepID=A0A2T7PA26_POMCA|nr:hypothetical protein C0Q70_09538 [Pomacea canaliculata]